MSRNRPKRLLAELETIQLAGDLFGRRAGAWPTAVGDLLDTPRALKFTLSAVTKTWERIHGEVDLDELIILTALRYRAGSVFSFLVRRALDLRILGRLSSSGTNADKQEKQQHLDELRAEWKGALSQVDANQVAVENLVGDLFPSAQAITGRTLWLHSNRLQSVNSSRGEIYMERITAGDLPREAIRDQTVLTLLHGVAAGHDVEVFSNRFVASREFAELAVFFDDAARGWSTEPHVSPPARLAAGSVMLRIESTQAGDNSLYQSSTHHLIQHWISNATNDNAYIDWAIGEILTRIPNRLFRATELYLDLFRDLHISTETQSGVRKQVLEKSRHSFLTMSAGEFATCFPSHFPYTLVYLIRLDSKTISEQLLTRLEDWKWLRPQLLAGLTVRPEILVPQVLPIFGAFGPQPGPFEHYRFDDNAVAQFFETDREMFYRRVAEPFTPPDKLEKNFARLLPLAADAARLILGVIEAGRDS
jgi:hypothetical protein